MIASNSEKFAVGDFAFGQFGWATHGCKPDTQLRKVDPDMAPLTTSLGVLGMPGFTGWYGFHELGRPKAGRPWLSERQQVLLVRWLDNWPKRRVSER